MILPVAGSIKITINNFSHSYAKDVGILLVGPAGSMYIQDAAGDVGNMSNVTYTISDSGSTRLPQNGAWTAGTYKPTNYISDNFLAPAPAGPHPNPGPHLGGTATLTSRYGSTDPNGVWSLYVQDFLGGDLGSIAGGWSIEINTAALPPRAVLDFDGDGKTDDAVIRNVSGSRQWFTLGSATGFSATTWGLTADTAVPGDYDGDGKWDIAIFRSGVFYILRSSTGSLQSVVFGQAGDLPGSTQDFDGDGKADPTVVRNVGGSLVFFILRSTLGFTGVTFGVANTDTAVRGDFDGDGRADVAVYRSQTGTPANTFFILPSGGGPLIARNFGNFSTDLILPGDFDGDQKTDVAVYRFEASGARTWYWLRSSDGALAAVNFGAGIDNPVPGDYDGDGRTDPSVFRPGSPATFFHLQSTAGFSAVPFGTTGDSAVANELQVR